MQGKGAGLCSGDPDFCCLDTLATLIWACEGTVLSVQGFDDETFCTVKCGHGAIPISVLNLRKYGSLCPQTQVLTMWKPLPLF